MDKGRTDGARGALARRRRFLTLRGGLAAVLGGMAAVAVATAALAAPTPPGPEGPAPDDTVAIPVGTSPGDTGPVDSGPVDDGAGDTSWRETTPGAGSVAVVQWLDKVPSAWPVTITILDPGVTFADGSTSVDVITNAGGEPYELSLVGVPSGGVRVRMQEPERSDATFQDVVCESYGRRYPTVEIERGVELVVPPLGKKSGHTGWGYWRPFPVCWFENTIATSITLESRLDGATPLEGAAMAVVPVGGRVGSGGVFDDDGLFPIGTDPLSIQLTGFPDSGPMDVFIGQTTVTGTTIYAMACAVGDSTYAGPLESRSVAGRTVVGMTVPVAPRDAVSCSVDAANADLRAVKTASIGSAGPGSVFDYTIVATNAGRAPLFGAAMSDAVPAQLTVLGVTAEEATTTTCTAVGNQVDCQFGDLAAGAARTVRVRVSVHDDVIDASSITNIAIVRAEVPLWVPGLGKAADPAAAAAPGVVPTADRPPVFASAVQVLATNVVRAFAPVIESTTPPTTTTTAAPATTPATDPATTAAPTTSDGGTPATTAPISVVVDQFGPLPTVTGGPTLPSTGSDLSLLTGAAWVVAFGGVLIVLRRVRRPASR